MITSGAHWLVLAPGLLGAVLLGCLAAVRAATRLPLPLAGCVALALLVCVETVVLNALSAFGAVTRDGLVAAHLAVAAAALVPLRSAARAELRRVARLARPRRLAASLAVAPLLAIALLSALRYAPNNGDSMEYHLARVAHWLQNGSVGAYPTGSIRQTGLAAGAEYLLLALQGLSGSDRLGALVQLGAWLLVVLSAPVLARMAGAPRSVAPAAAVLAAAIPMGLLQASSTQNDLVASAMAIAVAAILVRVGRGRAARVALLLGAALAGAVLVKLTAVVAVLPVAALLAIRAGPRVRSARSRAALAAGAALAAALVAIEVRRPLALLRVPAAVARFTYPALGDWGDRALNAVRGAFRHLPAPEALRAAVGPMHFEYPSFSLVEGFPPLVPHEDFAGNPLHAALALAALGVLLWRWRALPARARWAAGSLVVAWVLFHAVFRDNGYVSRLQLPLFALSPALLAVLPRGRRARWVAGAGAALAAALALWVGASNHSRPPFAAAAGAQELAYYRTFGGERPRALQLAVLEAAERARCRRIGIFMGENGFDYPITWLAMRRGAEARHLLAADPWPCVVYAEPGSWPGWGIERPDVALAPAEWELVGRYRGTPYLFVRRTHAARPGGGG